MKLTDVKGIKTETAKALHAAGINSVEDLVAADAAALESQIGTVTVGQIKEWQSLASALIVQDEIKGTVRVKVIAPDGADLPGLGSRKQGGHYDVAASFASNLVGLYPNTFEMEAVK